MNNAKLRGLYRAVVVAFILMAVYITAKHSANGDFGLAVLGPVSLLFLLIPNVGEALLRIRLDVRLRIWIIGFSLLGFSMGTGLRWCDNVPRYDDFLHLLSGVMFTVIGLCLYARVRAVGKGTGDEPIDRRRSKLLQITYAFFFSMFIAVIWEIGEFLGYVFTGHDAQHTLTTGVVDTMEDLIACVLGSLVAALDFWLCTCKNRKTPLMGIVAAFDKANADR